MNDNLHSGFVKIYRSTIEKGWYKNSDYVHLWVHLLFLASHKKKEYLFNGKIINLAPGQFITSRKSLAEKTGINESKIERILKLFKTEQQIEQQNLVAGRLISILNWGHYQISEQQNEQQVNSKRTASEQRVNTIKNDKKDKNVKNEELITHPLQKKIAAEYPNVAKIKTQLTSENCETLLSNYSPALIYEVLDAMENMNGISRKYLSVNLTVNNWCKKRITPQSFYTKPIQLGKEVDYE